MKMIVLLKLHFVKFVIFSSNIIVLLRSLSRIWSRNLSRQARYKMCQHQHVFDRVVQQKTSLPWATVLKKIKIYQFHDVLNNWGHPKAQHGKDLALKPYKIQLVQELKLTDHSNRRRFAQNNLLVFLKKSFFQTKHIFIYDEANCRIWASEYPKAIIEKPLHAQRVTVWCAMWSGGVIVRKVIKNFDERINICQRGPGGHFSDIIFHS